MASAFHIHEMIRHFISHVGETLYLHEASKPTKPAKRVLLCVAYGVSAVVSTCSPERTTIFRNPTSEK